jgi:ADP-dependent NAD(P)H-hydrate dehydratase / NAD(P)H-hydrate epimerase
LIPLLTAEQVKLAEVSTIEAGTSVSELMLRAGNAIADRIDLESDEPGNATVLVGPGNNGGDGLTIAALLMTRGWKVNIWRWNRPELGDLPVSQEDLDSFEWVDDLGLVRDALAHSDVVVDAVFGAGSRSELPEDVCDVFDAVRSVRSERYIGVWAVDFPSGVDADTGEISERTLQADVTAMIGLPKQGCYRMPAARMTGEILMIDIGLRPPAEIGAGVPVLINALHARSLLPERQAGRHKRSVGTVLIVGGAPQYVGAPRLSGHSALRAGAGLVTIATPSSIVGSIASAVPELTFITLPAGEHATAGARMASIVRERMSEFDAMVLGPGLGTDAPIPDFLAQLLGFEQSGSTGIGFGSFSEPEHVTAFEGKAVLDADALNWLATRENWEDALQNAHLVLTPHAGELARLLGCERSEVEAEPWESALQAASRFKQVIVLKHGHTVVATPGGDLFVNDQAPRGLATAGSGDVLAGCIGAYLAQGLDPKSAAIAGVSVGTHAAQLAAVEIGEIGYVASDLISFLPTARDEIVRTRSNYS